jgi:hypothetical protein
LPEELAGSLSRGYLVASQAPGPFELINNVPAGAFSASGDAMLRFLLAMLGGGELEGRRILAPESFARMSEPQVVVAENALGLTLYEEHPYGVRLLGHGGDLAYFHAQLAFSPEHGFGVFVAQNSAGNGPLLSSVLVPALAKRYFAEPREPTEASSQPEPRDVSGSYMSSRRSDATLMRIIGLASQIRVRDVGAGEIDLGGRNALGNTLRYRAVAPDRYRALDGREEIAFERDAQGRAVRLLTAFPGVSYERVGLLDSRVFTYALVGSALAVALIALLAPLVAFSLRRALGAPARSSPRVGRVLIPLTAGLWLAHFAIAVAFLLQASREFWRLGPGDDGALIAAVALAWLAVPASLATTWRALAARSLAALVPALAFLALSWNAWHWRLLSNPLVY